MFLNTNRAGDCSRYGTGGVNPPSEEFLGDPTGIDKRPAREFAAIETVAKPTRGSRSC